MVDVPLAASISQRRFVARLELVDLLDTTATYPEVRASAVGELHRCVESMNTDNFIVRPHRQLVDRFRAPEAWNNLSPGDRSALADQVAGLPTQLPAEPEEAKRFDVLMLHVELAMLRAEPAFPRLRDQVRHIAGLIEEYPAIPAVAQQLELLADVQTDAWWEDVTLPMLELVRTRLRMLVGFIEKRKRKIVYTDFADEMGEHVEIEFAGLAVATDYERFRLKARAFLAEHAAELPIEKIRRNWPITADDLAELRRILVESGVGTADDCAAAEADAGSFGLFVRSLVGLDRAAAKDAFAGFLDGKTYNANQIEFVNLIIDGLTQHGVIAPRQIYESPFTDLSPQGPEGLFTLAEVDRLIDVIDDVRRNAEVA